MPITTLLWQRRFSLAGVDGLKVISEPSLFGRGITLGVALALAVGVAACGGKSTVTPPQCTPATESCNGVDDDCNGETDEEGASGCTDFFADQDGDGIGDSADARCLCAAEAPYTATVGGDCDDTNPETVPSAPEECNGVDDDCDGETDEEDAAGCTSYLRDDDSDGYGLETDQKCLCAPTAPYTATVAGDCNDSEASIHPSATEVCNGVDDNCDGSTDEVGATGCTPYLRDGDGDGYGLQADAQCLCATAAPYTATVAGDCDDANAAVYPGATEVCNGVDDNCDGTTDEGIAGCCTPDAQQACGATAGVCVAGTQTCSATFGWGPCLDAEGNPVTLPGQLTESCNGLDDDCDGSTDEEGAAGCTQYLRDDDGDSYGLQTEQRCLCAATIPYTATVAGDCDDANAATHPGATEDCNGVDDNCDGSTDEGLPECCTPTTQRACGVTRGVCVAGTETCSDSRAWGPCLDSGGNPVTLPDQLIESCNGFDDDCDGLTDEENATGCVTYYYDSDGDGYGVTTMSKCLCAVTGLYRATLPGDCDDAYATRFPGAAETCNGFDDNCDGQVDEGVANCCTPGATKACGVNQGVCTTGTSTCSTSRDWGPCLGAGGTPVVLPGDRVETCANSLDDDCDGLVNEEGATGCVTYYYDADGDGYGVSSPTKCLCAASGLYRATVAGDCNDSNAAIRPGAAEVCDGIDNNCNGLVDNAEIPLAQLCPTPAHATGTTCVAGPDVRCRPVCATFYHDLNGVFSDGCEVQIDTFDQAGQGNTCPGYFAGTIYDDPSFSHFVQYTGNIVPAGDVDHYYFYASDLSVYGRDYHPDIRFIANPGEQFRMTVYRSTDCYNVVCSAATSFSYYTDFNWTSPTSGGLQNCLLPDANGYYNGTAAHCPTTSQGQYYVVRVYRNGGGASADSYTIRLSNNLY
jgi:hypothetical protein